LRPPNDEALDELIIRPGETIRDAMTCIERNKVRIALKVDGEGRLLGTVSDGDLRRALLQGATLDAPVDPLGSHEPVTVAPEADRAALLDLMKALKLQHIPVVDRDRRLLGLHVLHEVLGSSPKPNHAVILAGGRGTRLGSLTTSTPKPMLSVAGRPILERLVLHLVGSGIRHIFLSVSYFAEQIQDHFGEGTDFGCTIEYLEESVDQPLGTGGPLRLLLGREAPWEPPLLVCNGDLIASFSVSGILEAHARNRAAMTIALRQYEHDVPFGVAKLSNDDATLITQLEEKPRWSGQVNAGIYVLERRLLETIPAGVTYPITDLVQSCLDRGERVAGWELTGDWHDIGRPRELAHARGEL
jgi:dTDP-glucose pyrophosphorylase